MLHTTCYDRLQSRRSCSCDKDISLLQMHDIRLFGMPSFLYHYQQIYHVLSSDFWYFTPSTCWKKVLILPKPARCGLSLPLLLLISFLQFTFFFIYSCCHAVFLISYWNTTCCIKSSWWKAALRIAEDILLPSSLLQKEDKLVLLQKAQI